MSKKPLEFATMLVDAMHHEPSQEVFSNESPRLLAVRLSGGRVRIRPSCIVAGAGRFSYTPPSRLTTPEGVDASAGGVFGGYEGDGRVMLADPGKEITILRMRNDESFGVAAHALIAVEDRAVVDPIPVASPATGAWNALMVTGPTFVALATHGAIRPFQVSPQAPALVKPGYVVGWTIGLTVEMKGYKPADARLSFSGTGCVFVSGAPDESWLKHS